MYESSVTSRTYALEWCEWFSERRGKEHLDVLCGAYFFVWTFNNIKIGLKCKKSSIYGMEGSMSYVNMTALEMNINREKVRMIMMENLCEHGAYNHINDPLELRKEVCSDFL
jgi:hypothetical protein